MCYIFSCILDLETYDISPYQSMTNLHKIQFFCTFIRLWFYSLKPHPKCAFLVLRSIEKLKNALTRFINLWQHFDLAQ